MAVVLVGAVAWAQTTTPVVTQLTIRAPNNAASYSFGPNDCARVLTATWILPTLIGSACSDLKFWATAGSCGESAGTGDVALKTVSQAEILTSAVVTSGRTGNFTFTLGALPIFSASEADAGVACGSDGIERTAVICGAVKTQSPTTLVCNTSASTSDSLSVVYDTKPPSAPVVEAVAPQDSALTVTLSAPTGAVTLYAEYRAQGEEAFGRSAEVSSSSTTQVKIANLVNDVTYEIRGFALDAAGNVSAPSEVVTAVPVKTCGLFCTYREDGGQDQGCSSSGGLLLSCGAMLAALWLKRVKR